MPIFDVEVEVTDITLKVTLPATVASRFAELSKTYPDRHQRNLAPEAQALYAEIFEAATKDMDAVKMQLIQQILWLKQNDLTRIAIRLED